MNELQVFNNEEFGKVRVVEVNGEGWLVGKDIIEALGYDLKTNRYGLYISKYVDEEDKLDCNSQSSFGINYKELGQRGGILINESGLYSLVLESQLPQAKKFRRWVTSEVLPSIRKHGAYMTEDTIEKALADPDFLIKLATQLKEEKEARRLAEEKLEQQKPLMDFVNTVTGSSDCIDMNEMAKLIQNEGIKLGRNKLFELLRENKILMSNNQPYQKYLDNGYFKVIETTKHTPYGDKVFCKTMVTGKGQVYIVQFVKSKMSNEESKEN